MNEWLVRLLCTEPACLPEHTKMTTHTKSTKVKLVTINDEVLKHMSRAKVFKTCVRSLCVSVCVG
jgi:hypothetical protein